MFKKIFGSAKEVKKLEKSHGEMEFLGEPTGSGLMDLRIEMASRLLRFPVVKNAYLSRLKYHGEEAIRVCIAIDADTANENQMQEIAGACAGFLPLDIIFLGSLSGELSSQLKRQSRPLFAPGLSLFECPILVTKGTNDEMPKNWDTALICMYVAAPDLESALLKAVRIIRTGGYEYKTVLDGKVNIIETQRWWDDFVLKAWPNLSTHFPSQERMVALVTAGEHFQGPILEWKSV